MKKYNFIEEKYKKENNSLQDQNNLILTLLAFVLFFDLLPFELVHIPISQKWKN